MSVQQWLDVLSAISVLQIQYSYRRINPRFASSELTSDVYWVQIKKTKTSILL